MPLAATDFRNAVKIALWPWAGSVFIAPVQLAGALLNSCGGAFCLLFTKSSRNQDAKSVLAVGNGSIEHGQISDLPLLAGSVS
jgi:hypothetical protein